MRPLENPHKYAIFPTLVLHLNAILISSQKTPLQTRFHSSKQVSHCVSQFKTASQASKSVSRQEICFQSRKIYFTMKNSIKNTLRAAAERLQAQNIENPRLDAEILLAHVLNCRRLKLYVDSEEILSLDAVFRFNELINQRLNGLPVAYIVGHKDFMGLSFAVNQNVLIPRPETEILTELVGEYLRGLDKEVNFLDLGVGSGAIAISILKFVKNARAVAVDVSEAALEVAKFNSAKFHVEDRIKFICGDLFEHVEEKFNAIVSNPPYIPSLELKTLQKEVKTEPKLALDGGEDGLDFYRRIIGESPRFLLDGGILAVEIGINQALEVKKLFEAAKFVEVEIFKDLSGLERVIVGKK